MQEKEQKEARQKGFKQVRYPWKHKFVFNPKWVDKAFTLGGKRDLNYLSGNWNGKRQPEINIEIT